MVSLGILDNRAGETTQVKVTDNGNDASKVTVDDEEVDIDFEDIKIFDDCFEDEESQNETLTSSSSSESDSDYDESMEQLHDELTRKEMARLKA